MVTIEDILDEAERLTNYDHSCVSMSTFDWGMKTLDSIRLFADMKAGESQATDYGLELLREIMDRLEDHKHPQASTRQSIINAHENLDDADMFYDWDASNPGEHVWFGDLLMVMSDFFHYAEEIFPSGSIAMEESLSKFAALIAHRLYLIRKQAEEHPLDKAIAYVEESVRAGFATPGRVTAYTFVSSMARNLNANGERMHCNGRVAVVALKWLQQIDSTATWQDLKAEYDVAKKCGAQTLDSGAYSDETRYFTIMEQIGRITACLPDNCELRDELEHLIAQVGMMALAWVACDLEKENQ